MAALLALALAAVVPAGADAHLAKAPRRCNGAKALCTRTFDRVVLPGAHNAMSAQDLGWKIPNQTIDIAHQLRYGIRALLIDSHYGRRQPDGTVAVDDDGKAPPGPRGRFLCHVACQLGETSLVLGLHDIRKWIKAHPDNVLVIVNEDYVSPHDFVRAMHQSGLSRSVYRGSTRRWPTLRHMIRKRQQVVVLAEHHAGAADWYQSAYDRILQETPYTFKTSELLTDPANWRASCAPNRGGRTGSLFLMNHWSPDVPPQTPDLAASAAVNAKDVIVGRAEACRTRRGRLPSIVAVDQARAGGLLAAVRQLNR